MVIEVVVLKFVVTMNESRGPVAIPATRKCAQDADGRVKVQGILVVPPVLVTIARFIDDIGAENLGVAHME